MEFYNNPFAMRASEKITSDDIFLDLLSPDPLNVLSVLNENDKLWGNVSYIESSPGGGKTTLLRMFSPEVLRRISTPKHKDFDLLIKKMGVKQGAVINKNAVYVLIGRDYAFIDDEFTNNVERRGVFLALLNVRIMIATIKTIMSVLGLAFNQIQRLLYNPTCDTSYFQGLTFPCDGQDLMKWVANRESEICNTLASYRRRQNVNIMDNALVSLELMNPAFFSFGEIANLGKEFIFQLDDVHKLTFFQNDILKQEVIEHRITQTLWIARRFEALSNIELLGNTDKPGRDYNVIRLEVDRTLRYNQMLKKIAEKRSKYSMSGIQLLPSLIDNFYDQEFDGEYKKAAKVYLKRIQETYNLGIYHEWLDWIMQLESWKERAIYLRAFIIYYNRDKERGLETGLFPLDAIICKAQLEPFLPSSIDLVCLENKIPYYYGAEKLLSLSTNNVEQFLHFAEHLYSALLAKHIMPPFLDRLSPLEQEKVICDVSKKQYDTIENLPNGENIKCFLEHLVHYCAEITYSPTFSYRFVSGFAIKQDNRLDMPELEWYKEDDYIDLSKVIKDCVAFNLLESCPTKQGEQGQLWTVYYLSRWICVAKGLALSRGGWRKLNLKQLNNWVN